MLTDEDVKKIVEVVATKEDVKELKTDVGGLRESVQALTISVDGLVKSNSDIKQEDIMTTGKVNRHERWLLQIAEKVGLKLEY